MLAPTYLEKLSTALDNHQHAAVAFSDTLLTQQNGKRELWQYTTIEGKSLRERAFSILQQKGKWWTPNRGLFRTSSAQSVGSLRTHDSGEFSADLPWLFHLALTGEFVRVPEVLCFKYYRSSSLSRSWEFNNRERYDVLVACMREIWLSKISVDDKLYLATPLLKYLSAARKSLSSI